MKKYTYTSIAILQKKKDSLNPTVDRICGEQVAVLSEIEGAAWAEIEPRPWRKFPLPRLNIFYSNPNNINPTSTQRMDNQRQQPTVDVLKHEYFRFLPAPPGENPFSRRCDQSSRRQPVPASHKYLARSLGKGFCDPKSRQEPLLRFLSKAKASSGCTLEKRQRHYDEHLQFVSLRDIANDGLHLLLQSSLRVVVGAEIVVDKFRLFFLS
ncbi:hypothetical protein WN48_08770 [Eufriesea mexicana]|nr:hypothetical protein WN48_08770 [Eufriesea mexicana]